MSVSYSFIQNYRANCIKTEQNNTEATFRPPYFHENGNDVKATAKRNVINVFTQLKIVLATKRI